MLLDKNKVNIVADRQFFLVGNEDGSATYKLGMSFPEIIAVRLLGEDLEWQEVVVERRDHVAVTLDGAKGVSCHVAMKDLPEDVQVLRLITHTACLTEGRRKKLPDGWRDVVAVLASLLHFGNLQTAAKTKKLGRVRDAVKEFIEWQPEDYLSFYMELAFNVRRRAFIELLDWLDIFNAFHKQSTKAQVKMINRVERYIFQILCYDFGIIPAIKIAPSVCSFTIRNKDLTRLYEMREPPEGPQIFKSQVTFRDKVFCRSVLLYEHAYVGNNVLLGG